MNCIIWCQWGRPCMVLMFEERVHITFSRLTRYVHPGEQLHISLKIGYLGSGFFLCVIQGCVKQWQAVLWNGVIEWWDIVSDTLLNESLVLSFPDIFDWVYWLDDSIGHEDFGIKCVKVCSCVGEWVAQFIEYLDCIFHLGPKAILYTSYLFMMLHCILISPQGVFCFIFIQ